MNLQVNIGHQSMVTVSRQREKSLQTPSTSSQHSGLHIREQRRSPLADNKVGHTSTGFRAWNCSSISQNIRANIGMNIGNKVIRSSKSKQLPGQVTTQSSKKVPSRSATPHSQTTSSHYHTVIGWKRERVKARSNLRESARRWPLNKRSTHIQATLSPGFKG